MGNRALKATIRQLLTQEDFATVRDTLRQLPGRQAVNPLFSFFYSGDERLRWRAIAAMGVVVSHLAATSMESARVVMRRLMWNLNDESGGIGWGSPETMGVAVAGSRRLAAQYSHILFSYLLPDGNYLEHPMLQRGSLWGAATAVHAGVGSDREVAAAVTAFLASEDPCHRGLAAWFLEAAPFSGAISLLEGLRTDRATFQLFADLSLSERSVGQMAAAALESSAA